jgi:hypothetical protein
MYTEVQMVYCENHTENINITCDMLRRSYWYTAIDLSENRSVKQKKVLHRKVGNYQSGWRHIPEDLKSSAAPLLYVLNLSTFCAPV